VRKKTFIPVVIIAVLLCVAFVGFKYIDSEVPINATDSNETEESTPADAIIEGGSNQVSKIVPSLGGISLGDSPEKVISELGNDYSESIEIDNAGIIGEDVIVWSYESGIAVSFGKTSGRVIRVVSESPDFHTDLDIKVGDNAKTALEVYKTKFKEAISRHSDE